MVGPTLNIINFLLKNVPLSQHLSNCSDVPCQCRHSFALHESGTDFKEIWESNHYHQHMTWLHFGQNCTRDKGAGYDRKFKSTSNRCCHVANDFADFAVHTVCCICRAGKSVTHMQRLMHHKCIELGRFVDRRSEIGKIGTHQKIGESDTFTVRFRFACGRHAACQINWCIHNSTAHGEHLAATVTRAWCRKQTGGEGVRGGSAVGQPTSLIFASYRRSFDVYSGRVCTACMRWPRC